MSSQRRLSCEANIRLITFQLFSIVFLCARELEQLVSTILGIIATNIGTEGRERMFWPVSRPRPSVSHSTRKSAENITNNARKLISAPFSTMLLSFSCAQITTPCFFWSSLGLISNHQCSKSPQKIDWSSLKGTRKILSLLLTFSHFSWCSPTL